MEAIFSQLADYVLSRRDWIIERWVQALEREGAVAAAEKLTYHQLVDHIPSLCEDLAVRLRGAGGECAVGENQHARLHAQHRWQQGYALDEVIREIGLLQKVLTYECLEPFAKVNEGFDAEARARAGIIIHDLLAEEAAGAAVQFAQENAARLTASERNSQAILDSALDSIIVMDQQGLVREFNPAAEKLFGYTRADVIGKEVAELIVPPAFRERHRRGIAQYNAASKDSPLLGKRVEVPALRADGSEFPMEISISPFRIGDEVLFASYMRDISSRRRGEEAAQWLSAIIVSSEDAIISKDLNGVITSWNEGAERVFGYTPEETIGKSITMLMPPERVSEEPGFLARLRRGERIAHHETVRRRKDGSDVHVALTVSPIRSETGEVVGASKIVRDITERVRQDARRAAQYSIATLLAGESSLAETAPKIIEAIAHSGDWVFGALWLRDRDGVTTCHSTWRDEKAEGIVPFEQLTRTMSFEPGEGIPTHAIEANRPVWAADLSESPSMRAESARKCGLRSLFVFPLALNRGIEGAIELVSCSAVAPDQDLLNLADALGVQIGLYVDRKHIEDELRRQKDASDEANRSKDKFLAALSHELRTPLNPVLIWACETLEARNLDPELRDGLRMVCRNVELEARLIDDLLDITRITQGKLHLNFQHCDTDTLLQNTIEIVRADIKDKGIALEVDLRGGEHRVLADSARLQQVFWNLLKNAQKFTPAGGTISVRSHYVSPGTIVFEFRDTGRGIDPELMTKLFTAFEQGGTATGEGLGLGLAIAKAIIGLHDGKISAASDGPGKGAVFTVQLNTMVEQGVNATTRNEPPANAPDPPRQLKILIVEDHESTANIMKRLLERSGHAVLVADTVKSALAILRTTELDLLVSDLGLPDGNGFQVMQALSKVSAAKGIAVSGYGMAEDLQRSTEAGFSAHLTKPLNVSELKAVIAEVTAGA